MLDEFGSFFSLYAIFAAAIAGALGLAFWTRKSARANEGAMGEAACRMRVEEWLRKVK